MTSWWPVKKGSIMNCGMRRHSTINDALQTDGL